MFYRLVRLLAALVFRALFRLRVEGTGHVPPAGPVLLAANHVSFLDPPAVGAAVVRPLHFLAKAELFRVPGLGAAIRRLGAHPVERTGSDAAALRLARSLLAQGHALLVFPEGTRGQEGVLRAGRAGVGLLAALSQAPVVPVYIRGTGRALPRGAVWPRPVRVTVSCGPPLRFAPGRGKDRYQEISDQIMAAIGRLRAEAERRPAEAAAQATRDRDTDRATRGLLPAGQLH